MSVIIQLCNMYSDLAPRYSHRRRRRSQPVTRSG